MFMVSSKWHVNNVPGFHDTQADLKSQVKRSSFQIVGITGAHCWIQPPVFIFKACIRILD